MIEKNEMIFGVRAVIEAIQAGKEIDKVLIKKDIQSDLSKELFAVLKDTFIPVQRVRWNASTASPRRTIREWWLLSRPSLTSVRKTSCLSCLSRERTRCSSCWTA